MTFEKEAALRATSRSEERSSGAASGRIRTKTRAATETRCFQPGLRRRHIGHSQDMRASAATSIPMRLKERAS